MIIFNDLNYNVCSDCPNSDWTNGEDTKYVIDDNSDLAKKIIKIGDLSNCDFVEDDGKLIDIVAPVDISELKANKIAELNTACESTILKGVDVNGKHYKLTEYDQIALLSHGAKAERGMTLLYHADGEACRPYEPAEMLQVCITAEMHVTKNKTYCNLLKKQVEVMKTVEEVEAVTYGVTELTEENQAIIDTALSIISGGGANAE